MTFAAFQAETTQRVWEIAIGAAVSPLVISAEIGHPALGWEAAFLTCAAAFLVSGLAALGVDAREPLRAEA